MKARNQATLDAYLAFWAGPSLHRDMTELDALTVDGVSFRDPINDVRGRDALRRILSDATESVANAKTEICGTAWVEDGRAFIKWRYSGELRRLHLKPWAVTGMSEITFADDGRVSSHEDHWDLSTGLFEHFPFIGWIFRHLRNRLRPHFSPTETVDD